MSFTNKSLQPRSNMGFLKGMTIFFLWASCVLFITNGFDITPIAKNAVEYIQSIFLTTDGSNTTPTTISLDGANGTITASTVSGSIVCIGNVCNSTWPVGWGATWAMWATWAIWATGADWIWEWSWLWSTWIASSINYMIWNVGIGTTGPAQKLDINGWIKIWTYASAMSHTFTLSSSDYDYWPPALPQCSCDVNPNINDCGPSFIAPTWGPDCWDYNSNDPDYFVYSYYSDAGPSINCTVPWTIIYDSNKFYWCVWLLWKELYTPAVIPGGIAWNIQFNNWTNFSGGNDLFWNSTTKRLGIGTNNPQAELHVVWSNGVTMNLEWSTVQRIQFMSGWVPSGTIQNSTNPWWWFGLWTIDLRSISFIVNNLIKMVISATGNVGIGTTTPAYLLDVNGTGRFQNSLLVLNGNVGIGTSTPSAKLEVNGGAKVSNWGLSVDKGAYFWIDEVNSAFVVDDSANGTHPIQVDNDTQQAILFDSLNFWYNVGIGTSTPAYRLDVLGVGRFTSNLLVNGNVGIGTSSPSTKLAVADNIWLISVTPAKLLNTMSMININSNPSAWATGLILWNLKIPGLFDISMLMTHGIFGIYYDWDQNNPRVTVLTWWNVGIGTSTPTSKFDVAGSIWSILMRPGETSDFLPDSYITIHGGSSTQSGLILWNIGFGAIDISQIASPSGPLGIYAWNFATARIIINTWWLVGIGTDTPTEKLEVAWGIKLDQYSTAILTVSPWTSCIWHEGTMIYYSGRFYVCQSAPDNQWRPVVTP